MNSSTKKGLAFAFCGALVGVGLSIKPWQKLQDERASASKANAEMRAIEKERIELLRNQTKMESAAGREDVARARGYKKPEEIPWNP